MLLQSQLTRLPFVRNYIGLQPLPSAEALKKSQEDPVLNPGLYDSFVAIKKWYGGVREQAGEQLEAARVEEARRKREEKSLRVAGVRQGQVSQGQQQGKKNRA